MIVVEKRGCRGHVAGVGGGTEEAGFIVRARGWTRGIVLSVMREGNLPKKPGRRAGERCKLRVPAERCATRKGPGWPLCSGSGNRGFGTKKD